MSRPRAGHGYGGMTREEKKGFVNFTMVGAILLCVFVEIASIYRYYTGKYVDLSMFLVPALAICYCILFLFVNNRKKGVNKCKKNGIRVMGKVEEIEKYSIYNNRNSRRASEEFTDYNNSGYGRQAYRVYVRVVNPHTGEDMVCISLGQSHPLEGYNLKEIPVYFHKKKTGGYYVDVKEAIENNL